MRKQIVRLEHNADALVQADLAEAQGDEAKEEALDAQADAAGEMSDRAEGAVGGGTATRS